MDLKLLEAFGYRRDAATDLFIKNVGYFKLTFNVHLNTLSGSIAIHDGRKIMEVNVKEFIDLMAGEDTIMRKLVTVDLN